jgi:hypothetical protein
MAVGDDLICWCGHKYGIADISKANVGTVQRIGFLIKVKVKPPSTLSPPYRGGGV